MGMLSGVTYILVLEVTMRDGNKASRVTVSLEDESFRSDYEGWKLSISSMLFGTSDKNLCFRSDYEGWKHLEYLSHINKLQIRFRSDYEGWKRILSHAK